MKTILSTFVMLALVTSAQASVITPDEHAPCVLDFTKQDSEYVVTAVGYYQDDVYGDEWSCEEVLEASSNSIGTALHSISLNTGAYVEADEVFGDVNQGSIAYELADSHGDSSAQPRISLFPDTLSTTADPTVSDEEVQMDETELTSLRLTLLGLLEELLSLLRIQQSQ